jgi:hypothetical protein
MSGKPVGRLGHVVDPILGVVSVAAEPESQFLDEFRDLPGVGS